MMLHTKYQGSRPCGFRPKENYVLFPITCPKFLGSVGRQTFLFIKTFLYGKSMKSLKTV